MMTGSRWCGLAVLALAAVISIPGFQKAQEARKAENSAPAARRTESHSRDLPDDSTRAAGVIAAEWEALLKWLGKDPKPNREEIHARLIATRSAWAEMDPHVLAETAGRLLATHADAAIDMKFRVGPHGLLDGWPSLRVFLLDALASADPESAANIARGVLDHTASPDEYAVALRAMVRPGPGQAGEVELLARFQNLLDRKDWHASGGFAEALDLARTLGTATAATPLLEWDGNPALKSMALHEFAAEHPAEILESMKSAPQVDSALRADLMARLDPAEADQTEALDEYLRDPQVPASEAAVFLKSFPLRSATTGHRLYGRQPAPYQMERIAAGDQAALALVDGWMENPALEALRPELLALRKRLGEWVAQAR